METLKTAVVVVLLLAVLAGVYVLLNQPHGALSEGLLGGAQNWAPDEGGDASSEEFDTTVTFESAPEAASAVESDSKDFSIVSPTEKPLTPPPLESNESDQLTRSGLPRAEAAAYLHSSEPEEPRPNSNTRTPAPFDSHEGHSHEDHSHDHSAASDSRSSQASSASERLSPPGRDALTQPRTDSELRSSPSSSSAAEASSTSALTQYAFRRAWRKAQDQYDHGKMAEALLTLSVFFRKEGLGEEQASQLLDRLDQLAGVVIYSRQHRLEPPHIVRRGETLREIAQRHQVPSRLLQNINGVQDPELLLAGRELKVLRGPFRAEIDLQKGELIVFLGQLYGGRFPISVGENPKPQLGHFTVLGMEPGHTFFDATGRSLPSTHPENPYGNVWLDLGRGLSVHGSSGNISQGCVSLSPRDASDIYAILAEGSRVDIR